MCLRKSPQAKTGSHKTDEITLETTLLSVFHEFLFSLQPICISLRENVSEKMEHFANRLLLLRFYFKIDFLLKLLFAIWYDWNYRNISWPDDNRLSDDHRLLYNNGSTLNKDWASTVAVVMAMSWPSCEFQLFYNTLKSKNFLLNNSPRTLDESTARSKKTQK